MVCTCPSWEFAADSHLLKLHYLQNKVLHTIGNLSSRTPTRDFHVAFKIPYKHDFVTKRCKQQTEVIQNHENVNVRNIGQSEVQHRKFKRLRLGGGQTYDCSRV
jgi:hypothetical protein